MRRLVVLSPIVLAAALAVLLGPPPAASGGPDDDDREDRLATGQLAFRDNCLMCHAEEMTARLRLTEKQWAAEVDKMVGWGAPVKPELKIRRCSITWSQPVLGRQGIACRPPPGRTRLHDAEVRLEFPGFPGRSRGTPRGGPRFLPLTARPATAPLHEGATWGPAWSRSRCARSSRRLFAGRPQAGRASNARVRDRTGSFRAGDRHPSPGSAPCASSPDAPGFSVRLVDHDHVDRAATTRLCNAFMRGSRAFSRALTAKHLTALYTDG